MKPRVYKKLTEPVVLVGGRSGKNLKVRMRTVNGKFSVQILANNHALLDEGQLRKTKEEALVDAQTLAVNL